jgi:NDP-sugar pyrophosphorylase family protein
MAWIDYGLGGLTAPALEAVQARERDLPALYNRLAAAGSLFGYEAKHRFFEIGTPAALAETETFLRRHAQ